MEVRQDEGRGSKERKPAHGPRRLNAKLRTLIMQEDIVKQIVAVVNRVRKRREDTGGVSIQQGIKV